MNRPAVVRRQKGNSTAIRDRETLWYTVTLDVTRWTNDLRNRRSEDLCGRRPGHC